MSITFKELTPDLANRLWVKFAPYHYDYGTRREKLANNSRRYLAVENGAVIGFAAIVHSYGHEGWRSHKVATLPHEAHRWSHVADALAQFVTGCGHEYYCSTPTAFAAYREGKPEWRKVSAWGELSSWQYIGG